MSDTIDFDLNKKGAGYIITNMYPAPFFRLIQSGCLTDPVIFQPEPGDYIRGLDCGGLS